MNAAGQNPWARLLRVPNLLTVPGDPLAGIFLGAAALGIGIPAWWRIVLVAAASLAVYCYGLVVNDLADLPRDTRLRSDRPLARGEINVAQARAAAAAFVIAALAVAGLAGSRPLLITLWLLVLVTAYTFTLKSNSTSASIGMGLCRGFNLLLGASLLGADSLRVLVAVAGVAVYVGAVTYIARFESTGGAPSRNAAMIPVGAFGVTIPVLLVWSAFSVSWAGALLAMFVWACGLFFTIMTIRRFVLSRSHKGTIMAGVGRLLKALLLWQAALVFVAGQPVAVAAGLVLLALYPVNQWLSFRISPT